MYTLGAVAALALVGRRRVRDEDKPLVWLAILIVASLRSPFLPEAYASFPAFWLVTLLGAKASPNAKTLWIIAAVWVVLNFDWPIDWRVDPRLLALVTLAPQAIVIALAVRVLRSAVREPALTPDMAAA